MTVTSKERHERIVEKVLEKKHLSAGELAKDLGVSEATIRRDLKALGREGRLELYYGGASISRSSDYSFQAKSLRNVEAKRAVGRLAAELVGDGERILLDSGTTCCEVIPHIKQRLGLSVIVNSARLALELDAPGISVIMIGGQYRPDRLDNVGPLSLATLEHLRGYVAFIGADGLSIEFGPAAADIDSAHLYGFASKNAREMVLLVDHSKFSTPSLYKIVDWQSVSKIITDREVSDEWAEFLKRREIDLIYPEQGTNRKRHKAAH